MLSMTNGELFTFVDVRVPGDTMLDFEVEDTVVVWKLESFGVYCLRVVG